MRPSCYNCCRKHLAQAIVLSHEVAGYPEHKWLVIGHMAEAEAEITREHPVIAMKIRDARKIYEELDQMANLLPLIVELTNLSLPDA